MPKKILIPQGGVKKMQAKLINAVLHKEQINSVKKKRGRDLQWGYDRYTNICLSCSEAVCQLDYRYFCSILKEKAKERKEENNEQV